MINIRLFFVLLLASLPAQAMDHRGQIGVGASLGLGFAAPWAQNEFEKRVGAGPAGAFWARYVPGTPEVGFEVSYNYFQLSKMDLKTHSVIGTFFSRQNPWGNFHPFYGFGVGWQTSKNFYTTGNWETPIFRLVAGIEFEMNERTDIGFYLNHYTIFKNKAMTAATAAAGTDEANAHVLAPSLTFTYYFGTPDPLPVAPSPIPTPAPTPVAAPAPAVKPAPSAFDGLKADSNATAAKPKAQAKKPAKKKPAPKKKRNR
jgi:hypothetical protein